MSSQQFDRTADNVIVQNKTTCKGSTRPGFTLKEATDRSRENPRPPPSPRTSALCANGTSGELLRTVVRRSSGALQAKRMHINSHLTDS
ncbi:hypothetical protein F2P79_005153 [Pimephales promelas]|nr:hypothetical protein F2P79_005153 [Pimephales promelas]